MIATQVNNLSKNIIDTVATPILAKIFNEKIQNQYITLFDIKFMTGNLLINIINFIVIMIFIYYLYKLTKKDGMLVKFLNNIKEKI